MKPESPPVAFIGHYPMKVDGKSRVVVPPLFREILDLHYKDDNNNVVVTTSMEKTISVYPMSSFNTFLAKLTQRSQLNSKVRALTNAFTMCSSVEKLDSVGKITIKDFLRQRANIDKEVYIVGCTDHFEIWPADRFTEYITRHLDNITELGDTIED